MEVGDESKIRKLNAFQGQQLGRSMLGRLRWQGRQTCSKVSGSGRQRVMTVAGNEHSIAELNEVRHEESRRMNGARRLEGQINNTFPSPNP